MASPEYEYNVFLNCPFDDAYLPLFRSLVFAIHDCGFVARTALEVDDASEVRIDKVGRLIATCRFGIHDISRTESDPATGLPRFNMPLELGMFLGAKRYGRAEQKLKSCLILDVDRYRYQKFVSDIAGQDIAAHGGEPSRAIRAVRDWLSSGSSKSVGIPGATVITSRYHFFLSELQELCAELRVRSDELTFKDYVALVEEWLRSNPHARR